MLQSSEVARLNVDVPATRRDRWWFLTIAALGGAWNAFGVVQFLHAINATMDSLTAGGLSPAQASLYLGLPTWMDVAFAVGVFGGLVGALALAMRRRSAVPIFIASMGGYVVLFAGDLGYGLFDLMPAQLPILIVVLAISGLMLHTARTAVRRQWLR